MDKLAKNIVRKNKITDIPVKLEVLREIPTISFCNSRKIYDRECFRYVSKDGCKQLQYREKLSIWVYMLLGKKKLIRGVYKKEVGSQKENLQLF
jgi:hypothetical protein